MLSLSPLPDIRSPVTYAKCLIVDHIKAASKFISASAELKLTLRIGRVFGSLGKCQISGRYSQASKGGGYGMVLYNTRPVHVGFMVE